MHCAALPSSFRNSYTTIFIALFIICLAYCCKNIQTERTTIFVITTIIILYILRHDPTFLCNIFKKDCLRTVSMIRIFMGTISLITLYSVWKRLFNHHELCLVLTIIIYIILVRIAYRRYFRYKDKKEVEKIIKYEKNMLQCQFVRILLISILFFFDMYLILTYKTQLFNQTTPYQVITLVFALIICPILSFSALDESVKYDMTEIQIT